MSFADLEVSQRGSRPVELFDLSIGNRHYRYTSAEDQIEFNGVIYVPEKLERTNIVHGVEESSATVTLTVSTTNQFAQRFILLLPSSSSRCSITRVHRENGGVTVGLPIYSGAVKTVDFVDNALRARINLQSDEAMLGLSFPRFAFSSGCNYQVYDQNCGADPEDHKHAGIVTASVADTITIQNAGSSGHKFTGGFCRTVGIDEWRMVLEQDGDDLTLLLPFSSSPVGSVVEAFAGCDHQFTGDCAQVFDNVRRFGGWPYTPTQNPFLVGIA